MQENSTQAQAQTQANSAQPQEQIGVMSLGTLQVDTNIEMQTSEYTEPRHQLNF